ncbi:MAG: hypothetical protein Q8L68_03270 [Methylococcales bacterium]|nr:hypothetical protein [Methylococcales bacterium]
MTPKRNFDSKDKEAEAEAKALAKSKEWRPAIPRIRSTILGVRGTGFWKVRE